MVDLTTLGPRDGGLAGRATRASAWSTCYRLGAIAACPAVGAGPVPDGLDGAMQALLARGAHGSYGALPGFLLSELGTAVVAAAMLGSRAFGRLTPWAGLVGTAGLTTYTVAMTVTAGGSALVGAVAVPAGVAMLLFSARPALTLTRMTTQTSEAHL